MDVGKIILAQVGLHNLLCFAARDFKYGKTDRKTHYGYLEFTASGNPNFVEEVRVRIELSPNDTYAVKVFDLNKNEKVNEPEIYCEDLTNTLFEILG